VASSVCDVLAALPQAKAPVSSARFLPRGLSWRFRASLANQLSIPVIGSPLFIISTPDLVLAQCKAGVIGSFPSLNARPIEPAGRMADAAQRGTGGGAAGQSWAKVAPYAVNLIVHKSNNRIEEDLRSLREARSADRDHVTRRAAGSERGDPLLWRHRAARHHQRGVRTQALKKGADGLIAVCAGAGGMLGRCRRSR